MIGKRIFDLTFSLFGLLLLLPFVTVLAILVWLQDFQNPLYIAQRVGKKNTKFNLVKLRSMIINADKSGVDSTSASDSRITRLGKFIRKFKFDELTQLWNVLVGDMSFVGPRPNVEREIKLYTEIEKELLNFKPGITDISSIVFSDESEILEPYEDPDIAYNQIIRPRKNSLALFYVRNQSLFFDIKLIVITILSIFNKSFSKKVLLRTARKMGANNDLLEMIRRDAALTPMPPPGSNEIVISRNV